MSKHDVYAASRRFDYVMQYGLEEPQRMYQGEGEKTESVARYFLVDGKWVTIRSTERKKEE